MKPYEQDPKYMLEHKDEFEQLEYGDLEGDKVEESYFATLFNNTWSYCELEANAKEGWIKILAYNIDMKKRPIKFKNNPQLLCTYDPYVEVIDDEWKVAKPKLYGEVIIFKLDPKTLELVKKYETHT